MRWQLWPFWTLTTEIAFMPFNRLLLWSYNQPNQQLSSWDVAINSLHVSQQTDARQVFQENIVGHDDKNETQNHEVLVYSTAIWWGQPEDISPKLQHKRFIVKCGNFNARQALFWPFLAVFPNKVLDQAAISRSPMIKTALKTYT